MAAGAVVFTAYIRMERLQHDNLFPMAGPLCHCTGFSRMPNVILFSPGPLPDNGPGPSPVLGFAKFLLKFEWIPAA